MTQPLEGIRVVEIGDGVAVACTGKQFADFGPRSSRLSDPVAARFGAFLRS